MKRIVRLGMIAGSLLGAVATGSLVAETQWQLPDASRRYNECAWLTAHNAFSSLAEGYIPYAQQKWNLTDQLKHGVRALMLDIYPEEYKSGLLGRGFIGGEKERVVSLCHADCALTKRLFRPFRYAGNLAKIKNPRLPSLENAFKEVRRFIEDNPKEIVTIFFEDKLKDGQLLDKTIRASGIDQYMLTPSNYKPDKHKGWPTLQEMQDKDQRVVMFSDKVGSDLVYNMWNHIIENEFSTKAIDTLRYERDQSTTRGMKHNRYLYLFNYFDDFPIPYQQLQKMSLLEFVRQFKERINHSKANSTGIRTALDAVLKTGLFAKDKQKKKRGYTGKPVVLPGQYPNFIGLDFVNKGDPVALINEINNVGPEAFGTIPRSRYFK